MLDFLWSIAYCANHGGDSNLVCLLFLY